MVLLSVLKGPVRLTISDIKKANESTAKALDAKDHLCFLILSHHPVLHQQLESSHPYIHGSLVHSC